MKKSVFVVFVMIMMLCGGGCSLFLGPLSDLSEEAVVYQESVR